MPTRSETVILPSLNRSFHRCSPRRNRLSTAKGFPRPAGAMSSETNVWPQTRSLAFDQRGGDRP